jgi:non-homologous end joining protein Ku
MHFLAAALKPKPQSLRFEDEVRDAKDYLRNIPKPRIDKEMVELASHILESKSQVRSTPVQGRV